MGAEHPCELTTFGVLFFEIFDGILQWTPKSLLFIFYSVVHHFILPAVLFTALSFEIQ